MLGRNISFCHHSATTTFAEPLQVLKADIQRVLDPHARKTRTGFDCIHSTNISSLQPRGIPASSRHPCRSIASKGPASSGDSRGATMRIVCKASKLSFGMSLKDKDRTAETSVNG